MLFQLRLRCMLHVQEPQVTEVVHLLIKRKEKHHYYSIFFSVECTVYVKVQNEIFSKIVSTLFDSHFLLSANQVFMLMNNDNKNIKVSGRRHNNLV